MARSKPRGSVLPPSLAPLGLSRATAAEYVGVSVSKFDELVKDGRMPSPRRIDGRKVWHRREVDIAFDALPSDHDPINEWDEAVA